MPAASNQLGVSGWAVGLVAGHLHPFECTAFRSGRVFTRGVQCRRAWVQVLYALGGARRTQAVSAQTRLCAPKAREAHHRVVSE